MFCTMPSFPAIVESRALGALGCQPFSSTIKEVKTRRMALLEEPLLVSPHKGGLTLSMDRVEGRFLLSGGHDATLSVYDLTKWGREDYVKGNNLKQYRPIARTTRASASVFNAAAVVQAQWYPIDTGAFLSASSSGSLYLWNTETMQPLVQLLKLKSISSFDLSCAGRANATLCCIGSHDSDQVLLCDVRAPGATHSFTGHRGGITTVKWSPASDAAMATGGTDGTIRIWDIRKPGSAAAIVTLDRENTRAQPRRPYRSDYRHLRLKTQKSSPNNYSRVQSDVVRSHGNAISAFGFAEGGHSLVSAGRDGRLQLWDLTGTGHLVPLQFQTLSGKPAISSKQTRVPFWIQDDAKAVWVGNGSLISRYSLVTGGRPTQRLEGHLGIITDLEPIDNSMQLLSAATDGLILTWGREREQKGWSRKRNRQ